MAPKKSSRQTRQNAEPKWELINLPPFRIVGVDLLSLDTQIWRLPTSDEAKSGQKLTLNTTAIIAKEERFAFLFSVEITHEVEETKLSEIAAKYVVVTKVNETASKSDRKAVADHVVRNIVWEKFRDVFAIVNNQMRAKLPPLPSPSGMEDINYSEPDSSS